MSEDKHNTEYTFEISTPLLRPGMTLKAGPVSEDYVAPTAKKLMAFVRQINEDTGHEDFEVGDGQNFEDLIDSLENAQSETEYSNETVFFDQWLKEVNRIAQNVYEWQINFDETDRWRELYEDGVPAGKAIPNVLKNDAEV